MSKSKRTAQEKEDWVNFVIWDLLILHEMTEDEVIQQVFSSCGVADTPENVRILKQKCVKALRKEARKLAKYEKEYANIGVKEELQESYKKINIGS